MNMSSFSTGSISRENGHPPPHPEQRTITAVQVIPCETQTNEPQLVQGLGLYNTHSHYPHKSSDTGEYATSNTTYDAEYTGTSTSPHNTNSPSSYEESSSQQCHKSTSTTTLPKFTAPKTSTPRFKGPNTITSQDNPTTTNLESSQNTHTCKSSRARANTSPTSPTTFTKILASFKDSIPEEFPENKLLADPNRWTNTTCPVCDSRKEFQKQSLPYGECAGCQGLMALDLDSLYA